MNRFDTRLNAYLSDGANIPIAIDDHVQAVYKDSLIYLITGWSNSGNVPNVQIYDPKNDNWLTGTSVPNNNVYKVFGATGIIIGNTIYYHGGASTGFNFLGQSTLKIGQINVVNPTQITWSTEATNYMSYRAVAVYDSWTNRPVFVGGSEITYNFNGIAYNGSGGVPPKDFSIGFDASQSLPLGYGKAINSVVLKTNPITDSILPMDLRGVAFPFQPINYISGGIIRNQKVSNKTFSLEILHNTSSVNENNKTISFQLYPNPTSEQLNLVFKENENRTVILLDIVGKEVFRTESNNTNVQLDVATYPKGIYFVKVKTGTESSTKKIIVQ